MNRHLFHVWVDVPEKSGDGWNRYPDYSAEEMARAVRRALHDQLEFPATVEHSSTEKVEE